MDFDALTGAGIAKFRSVARSHRLAALAAVGALLALPALGGPAAVAALRYERAAIAAGQWWRLLSCHLVHFDARHLALNLAGLGLLWWLFVADARPRDWLLVVLAAALAVGGGLYLLAPAVGWYLGLSGVLHGVWAAAALFAWRRWPLEALVTGALLAGKLVAERTLGPLAGAVDAALPVIVAAHLYGALGGLAAAAALRVPRASL
jgi:rhomboid family GlyGly-CTERM serine protease